MESGTAVRAGRSVGRWLAASALALVAGLAPAGCDGLLGSESIADYPVYGSVPELIGVADLIVHGVAVSSRVEEELPELSTDSDPFRNPRAGVTEPVDPDPGPGMLVTITTVRITEVFRGQAPAGGLVEVLQTGGGGQREAHTTLLSTRATAGYVLFLSSYRPDRPYNLVNPEQGMYTVGDGGTLKPAGGTDLGIGTLDRLRSAVAAVD